MIIKDLYKLFLQSQKISTDTRKIVKGSLFFALKGEKFNGNKFANQAIERGSKYAIIDESRYKSKNCIVVNNVLETLQLLAKFHRNQTEIPIIGITGTNGKTTTKELINKVLRKKFKVCSTKGNLNNHIGVPLSILNIKKDTDIAIIEMGANHIGEILSLCKISQPTHGIITNIGKAHLKGFKDINGVVTAKKELYDFIKEKDGTLFVNSNDQRLMKISRNINRKIYGEGYHQKKENVRLLKDLFLSVNINRVNINSKLIGDFQAYNILAAFSIGSYFGVSHDEIKEAIEDYTPKNNRSEIVKTKNNDVILDAYNANPSSMRNMIYCFEKLRTKNKLCILGDMLELGEAGVAEHQSIIDLVKKLKIETIFVGNEFYKISTENTYQDTKELIHKYDLSSLINKTILLKGSRGIKLEEILIHL